MNNLLNPAPTVTPQAPGERVVRRTSSKHSRFYNLTDTASALVDSPASRMADALIALDDAVDKP
ncbi:hypothetical protein C8R43DRAFT_1123026 [Mycena crocata]|nr:hypothetical protein C8R43DRAFT_1123026 [Mycena crocata]